MNAITQLIKPLAYIRIKHPTKVYFDWWLPLGFAVLGWLFFYCVVGSPSLFGPEGLITGVNGLLQVLVGFYIAALAAIATFQKPGMDDKMAGDPVTLEEDYRGHTLLVELTRRRFLCYLFGYLSLISLTLYFSGVLAVASRHAIAAKILPEYLEIVKFAGLFLYLFVLANMFVTTLLGLYYMAHRLHLSEPKDTTEKN
jgi:hypothetical protein